jgi:alpha-glucosidase
MDGFDNSKSVVSIGEIHIGDLEEWSTYYGKNLDEMHLPFNFALLGVDWEADQIRDHVNQMEKTLQPGAWPNYVLGNHDESRLASRVGSEQARIAAMLLLTLRGTPTIYYGEEIGMTNGDIPPEMELDPAGLNQPGWDQGRDICRTPMQWSGEPWAGFSSPDTAQTWLPVAENYPEVNVQTQLNQPKSMLQLYTSLLALRKSTVVLQTGDYQVITDSPENTYCYIREDRDQKILICLNFDQDEKVIQSDLLNKSKILLSTYLDREGPVDLPLTLRSHEGCILKIL